MSQIEARIICNTDRRAAERRPSSEDAQAIVPNAPEPLSCVVVDISSSGVRIALVDEDSVVPDVLKIYIAERDLIADCTVMWRRGREIGLKFESVAILQG